MSRLWGATPKPKEDSVRYFQYWAEYGEKAQRPGGLERMLVKLVRDSLYFLQEDSKPVQFQCRTDGSINRDLASMLPTQDLVDWPGQMSEDEHDIPSDKRADLCRWSLTVTFEPESPNAIPRELRLCGADDGSSPKRLAFEAALQAFFLPRIGDLMLSTPRKVEYLRWREQRADSRTRYALETDDGILRLERHLGKERLCIRMRRPVSMLVSGLYLRIYCSSTSATRGSGEGRILPSLSMV